MPQTHNAIHSGTGLIGGLGRFAGLGDASSGVERLGETLTPVLDIWNRPDGSFLYGKRELALGFNAGAGGAATHRILYLINPEGSRLIAHITRVSCYSDAFVGTPWTWGVIAVIAAEVVAAVVQQKGVNRDTRWRRGTGMRNGQLDWAQNAVAFPGGASRLGTQAGATSVIREMDVIVGPGAAFSVMNETANQGVQLNVDYIERPALPGELQPA